MLLRFMIGLLVSGILMAGWFGPIGTAVDEWRAAQLANTLKVLSRAASTYARMNCPGVVYSGTTPLPCSTSAWPTSWSLVAGAGLIPPGMLTSGQVLSALDNASPISVGPAGGNAGSISVAVASPGIGQMVANKIPFATYATGTVTVPVLLTGRLGIWNQANTGILNTNLPP
jgi:type II secretory pathway pseudopilin PulG